MSIVEISIIATQFCHENGAKPDAQSCEKSLKNRRKTGVNPPQNRREYVDSYRPPFVPITPPPCLE